MKFYAPFCLPFLVGALVMAAVIVWKYVVWFAELPRADKKRVLLCILYTSYALLSSFF